MANPRRKHSKARTSQRRSVYYASGKAPVVVECPNCGQPHQKHRACSNCGTYRGRKVVETKENL